VHLSKDGEVIVHHDPTLERTTNGRGPVAARSAAELAGVDAGYGFPGAATGEYPYRGQGFGIPALRDVLARFQVPMIIELKTPSPELARKTIGEIRLAGATDRVALGSFHYRVLRAARDTEPRIPTGAAREETRWALYRSWMGWPLGRTKYREFPVPESVGRTTIVTPRFVEHAHKAGLPVKVWTVNDRDDIERLLGWGVDAIISDRPDVAVAACDARYPR
jgi:glycerophosphoryl diester phosphodiesterase